MYRRCSIAALVVGGVLGAPADCGQLDGFTDTIDFLALLAQWGGSGSCDFQLDGVDVFDLLLLRAGWGPCG